MQEHIFYLKGIELDIAIARRRKERDIYTVEVRNLHCCRYRITAIDPSGNEYDLIVSHKDVLAGLNIFSDNPKPHWTKHTNDGQTYQDDNLTILPYAGSVTKVQVDVRAVETLEPNIKRWFVYLPKGWKLIESHKSALPYESKLEFNNPSTAPSITINKK